MDFLKKYRRPIIYSFLGLYCLGSFIGAILLLVDIQDVIDMINYSKQSEIFIYSIVQYFSQLILTCISLITGLIATFKFYQKTPNYRIFTVCLNLLVMMFLNYFVSAVIGIMMASDYNMDLPGEVIAMLVLSIIGIFALSVSGSKGAENPDKKIIKIIALGIGAICLLANGCIICTDKAKFDTEFGIFSIILPLISVVLPFITGEEINTINEPKVNLVKGTTVSTEPTLKKQTDSSESAYESLLKLNDLHDKGIISDQEYNEKKIKYIDKL